MVEANGIDALVLDTVQFYAELGPIQLGMPYTQVAAAVHFDFSGYTPLCPYGWPHQTTPTALARNREGVINFVKLLESVNEGVKAHAERAGLKIDWEDPGSTLSPLASITQVPRAYDFESSHWPSQFHHSGPFHDGAYLVERALGMRRPSQRPAATTGESVTGTQRAAAKLDPRPKNPRPTGHHSDILGRGDLIMAKSNSLLIRPYSRSGLKHVVQR